MAKKPTEQEIAQAIVATGATGQQGADGAKAITAMLQTSPEGNDYLTEFNNAIKQKWNDTHANATIYDRFKTTADAPTLQAVVYEKVAPIDFDFNTDIDTLANDEKQQTRKIPQVHSILQSINLKQRFKTSTSRLELSKIAGGEAIGAESVVQNLGASYADDRTDKFISLVNSIESAKSGDIVNQMGDLANVSKFIQDVKYYTFKFKEKRTDIYNAYTKEGDNNAKSDTKLPDGTKPVVFIDPRKLYKIEGDYYATLYQLQEALPDVEFIEVDGLTGNRFAIMADERVVLWAIFNYEITSEQLQGRPSGELNHYLFSEEIMGTFNCFNRMVFKTA